MLRIPGITPGEVRLMHEAGIETAGHLAALGGEDATAHGARSEFLRRMERVRDQLARQPTCTSRKRTRPGLPGSRQPQPVSKAASDPASYSSARLSSRSGWFDSKCKWGPVVQDPVLPQAPITSPRR